jgi:serine/threonine-protein kinase HipA
MTKVLYVLHENQIVGELIQEKSGLLSYKYALSWLNSSDAFPISISIPLKEDVFPDQIVRPYFSGLLPEGPVRENVARKLGVSSRSDFKLLQYLGGDCAGALVLSETPNINDTLGQELISFNELSSLLETYSIHPLLVDHESVRLSLAGAQEKLPIIYEKNQFYLPIGTPSTHILKLPIQGYEFTVENEAFCLTLASLIGIHSVPAQIIEIGGRNHLLVQRYDRVLVDGKWKRLHQEDVCQAYSIPSENKYQNEGGPNVTMVSQIIKEHCSLPAKDLEQFLKQYILNFYIQNRDAHGKNYSIVYRLNSIQLAPQYDVLNTEVYPNLTRNMAMKLGKTYKPFDVSEDDWTLFAKDVGINKTYLKNLRGELLDRMKSNVDIAIDQLFKDKIPSIILTIRDHILHQEI